MREQGKDRMVYSTSVVFRIIFLGIAVVIILSVASVSHGLVFARLNVFSIILVAICLFAALYVERWTFDRKVNVFEKHVCILLFYARKKAPLDTLQKVVLHAPVMKYQQRPNPLGWGSRRTATLCVVDREDRVHRLDMARGSSFRDVRRSAQRLSDFCGIPLEDDTGDQSAEAPLS